LHRYPFVLGSTSLTYPNLGLIENVRRRPSEFNLVELTLEYPRSLPLTDEKIEELNRIKEKEGLTYSIHLPLSIRLASTNPRLRETSVEVIADTYERAEKLDPVVYTLHVSPIYPPGGSPLTHLFEITQFADRLEKGKKSLLELAEHLDPGKIAVENLFTDLHRLQGFLDDHGYRRCLDIGHLTKSGNDPLLHFYENARSISNVHLHGVIDEKDHQQLGPEENNLDLVGLFEVIKSIGYSGPVILEQFKTNHLDESLETIERAWDEAIA